MKGCVITALHPQVVTGESDRTHRLHTNDLLSYQYKPVSQLKAASTSLRSHPRPQSSLILHLNPVSASGPALCQWPGPRSIDLCFRFSAEEACEVLGHWATVSCQLSPANFHQSFAPPGAGTELGLGPAGGMKCLVLDLARPTQGHQHQPGARDLQLASGGHAVLQCSLQH